MLTPTVAEEPPWVLLAASAHAERSSASMTPHCLDPGTILGDVRFEYLVPEPHVERKKILRDLSAGLEIQGCHQFRDDVLDLAERGVDAFDAVGAGLALLAEQSRPRYHTASLPRRRALRGAVRDSRSLLVFLDTRQADWRSFLSTPPNGMTRFSADWAASLIGKSIL